MSQSTLAFRSTTAIITSRLGSFSRTAFNCSWNTSLYYYDNMARRGFMKFSLTILLSCFTPIWPNIRRNARIFQQIYWKISASKIFRKIWRFFSDAGFWKHWIVLNCLLVCELCGTVLHINGSYV